MKLITLLLLFNITYYNAQENKITDSLVKNIINETTWNLNDTDHCLTFQKNNCFYHHIDSTFSLENGYPYFVKNSYIKIVPHVLEQVQYKVIKLSENELILDSYFLKLTHKEIEAGKPKNIRLKKSQSSLRYVRLH